MDSDDENPPRRVCVSEIISSSSRLAAKSSFESLFPKDKRQAWGTWGDDTKRTVDELTNAIRLVQDETNEFERDVIVVRARLRRRLQRALNETGKSAGNFPRGEKALSEALRLVEDERNAHAKAVNFAKNYIDVESEQWALEQRSLRFRLEHVMDENRGLRRTVEVALGQVVLRRTLDGLSS